MMLRKKYWERESLEIFILVLHSHAIRYKINLEFSVLSLKEFAIEQELMKYY